ncbi:unnamed protein product, partial [Linum tenue]
ASTTHHSSFSFFPCFFSPVFRFQSRQTPSSPTIPSETTTCWSPAGGRQTFSLGFFSPKNSIRRYLGIWYHNVSEQTVIWVANRDAPLNDTSGLLSLDSRGNFGIYAANGTSLVWSAKLPAGNFPAQLLDSGICPEFTSHGADPPFRD